jgi:hypothetical protein
METSDRLRSSRHGGASAQAAGDVAPRDGVVALEPTRVIPSVGCNSSPLPWAGSYGDELHPTEGPRPSETRRAARMDEFLAGPISKEIPCIPPPAGRTLHRE